MSEMPPKQSNLEILLQEGKDFVSLMERANVSEKNKQEILNAIENADHSTLKMFSNIYDSLGKGSLKLSGLCMFVPLAGYPFAYYHYLLHKDQYKLSDELRETSYDFQMKKLKGEL
jgi:hypothetical protein